MHGSSLKSRTVAVVVPDEPSIKFWADGKGIPSQSLSALCNNKELKVKLNIRLKKIHHLSSPPFKMFIMEELSTLGHTYNLTAYEKVNCFSSDELRPDLAWFNVKVGSVYLHPDLFTVDNGLMTQAGLLKRRTLETYFKPQIDMMYTKLP